MSTTLNHVYKFIQVDLISFFSSKVSLFQIKVYVILTVSWLII